MNRRLPAEWETSHAVMLTWPHHQGDWAESFEAIHNCYLGIVSAIQPYANIIISAADEALAEDIRQDIGDIENISIFIVPSDDTWARDHGPITVYENDEPVLLDFVFNGWGNKYPSENDNRITLLLYNSDAFPGYDYQQVDFVLEGGSIETDGMGTLLTTSSCLLAATRNTGMNQAEIEDVLEDRLGLVNFIWLEHSELAGDDTDGHIDMLARFLNPQTIAYTACNNRDDANYASLAGLKAELEALRNDDAAPYTLVPLPMPAPIFNKQGLQLPASYANFLILNQAVLVPTYGVPEDESTLATLRLHFPKHVVTGVPCRSLIEQFGGLHCATMQLPQ
jgi:agmatine/peptidylarginine deiminase